jgi:hypothetical protein
MRNRKYTSEVIHEEDSLCERTPRDAVDVIRTLISVLEIDGSTGMRSSAVVVVEIIIS